MVIIVLAALLVVFYSLDLFAQNHPYGEVIDGKLTTVNRLLNANEVDKTIVMIEEASGGVIEIPMPEVASDYLIPLDSFKKGTLKEAYTLGCLYLENNDSAKTLTLFLRVVRDFKVVAGEVPLLMNILRYFEEVNNPKAALETLLRISGSTSEQGVLLDHLSKLNLPSDQFQETLGLLLGRMKSATDFLKAAVFLNGLGRSTDASEMYRKAVATARDCKGFLAWPTMPTVTGSKARQLSRWRRRSRVRERLKTGSNTRSWRSPTGSITQRWLGPRLSLAPRASATTCC